jgi:hypothetical protein
VHREPVDSEAIASIGYDPTRLILEVEFTPGSVYRYFDVPPEDVDEMRAAESKGRWFNVVFKPRAYRYRELSGRH